MLLGSLSIHGGLDGKESTCNAGDPGSIPGSGRSPGERNGYPLRYSWLENSKDRGAWRATVHGVTLSWTQLSDLTPPLVTEGPSCHRNQEPSRELTFDLQLCSHQLHLHNQGGSNLGSNKKSETALRCMEMKIQLTVYRIHRLVELTSDLSFT